MTRDLVFVTKPDCELCEAGLHTVRRAAQWLRLEVEVVTAQPAGRYAAYEERVPVVLAGGDRPVLEGRFGLTDAMQALLRVRLGR